MFIFRPVKESDLPALLTIAGEAGVGFSLLPNHVKAMEAKIHLSLQSFSASTTLHPKFYFFVLENSETHEIVGTSGINANVGVPWPFYKFKSSTLVEASPTLNISRKHRILHVVTEHENTTELGALYLNPSVRGEGRGTFISRARCLFIAEFQHLFADKIISDLRGVSNSSGISPFWEALGSHFFGMTYKEAAHLHAVNGSQFLMDLMPYYPIYVELLSTEAQSVIGKTHKDSMPARHVLEKEGFQFKSHVDIFDGGPTIEVAKNRLRTLLESKQAYVEAFKSEIKSIHKMMISKIKPNFCATMGSVELTASGGIVLEQKLANFLKLSVGDLVRYCPL